MLIYCLLLLPLFCTGLCSILVLFCNTLCPFQFCNHPTGEKRACCLTFIVIRMSCCFVLFPLITVPWVGLWCVIVEVSGHTHGRKILQAISVRFYNQKRIVRIQDGRCLPLVLLNLRHFHVEATWDNTNSNNLKTIDKTFSKCKGILI